jgi:hypothetical protein
MRNLALVGLLVLSTSTAASAQDKPPKPPRPGQCEPRAVGFNASGTLLGQALTQTAGGDTAKRTDDRYSGTVTVNVLKANHGAPTGNQTYTLENDRAKFHDADHDHVADVPAVGDRVKVKGKITRLKKKCDSSGFTPTIDVRRVHFKPPKPAA